ncbi:MAG: NUDIX domain-containing protein [Dehalococcoidia bacterium]|nr:NUDIX domain-containing protein [Dehalococcoidia bacterium]
MSAFADNQWAVKTNTGQPDSSLLAAEDFEQGIPSDERRDFVAVTRHLLKIFKPARLPEGRRRAAVLLPLYERDGSQHVVVTRRTDLVEHHKGQIAFPGGAVEAADNDILTTALRETEEEIGVDRSHVEVLGSLDDIVTITNFHVTPVVGVITSSPYAFTLHEREVAEIIEIPIVHLLDERNLVEEPRERDGVQYINYIYRYEGHDVWGATGRILHQYLELLQAGLDVNFDSALPRVDRRKPEGYA